MSHVSNTDAKRMSVTDMEALRVYIVYYLYEHINERRILQKEAGYEFFIVWISIGFAH